MAHPSEGPVGSKPKSVSSTRKGARPASLDVGTRTLQHKHVKRETSLLSAHYIPRTWLGIRHIAGTWYPENERKKEAISNTYSILAAQQFTVYKALSLILSHPILRTHCDAIKTDSHSFDKNWISEKSGDTLKVTQLGKGSYRIRSPSSGSKCQCSFYYPHCEVLRCAHHSGSKYWWWWWWSIHFNHSISNV